MLDRISDAKRTVFKDMQWLTGEEFKKEFPALCVGAIAVIMAVYHFYVAAVGLPEPMIIRSIHVAFVVALVYLKFPFRRAERTKELQAPPAYSWLVAAFGALSALYIVFNYENVIYRFPYVSPLTAWQYIFGIALLGLILEGTRRSIGPHLVVLVAGLIIYALYGQHFPWMFRHAGVTVSRLVDHLYLTPNGIFGSLVGTSATYVFLFVVFGSVFSAAGAGKFFLDLATGLTSKIKGGPAKASILASGFFATMTSSAVANVYVTGVHTIPIMIKTGMPKILAAAVEAVASNTGTLLPPVMGSSAFIIAEFNRISYLDVCRANLIPALLYLGSVYIVIHLEVLKLGIPVIPSDISVKQAIRERGHMIIPVLVVTYLLVIGRTPLYCAFYGTVSAFLCSYLRKHTRLLPTRLIKALRVGAENTVPIAMAITTASIAVGIIELTGVAGRITSLILRVGGESLPITLLLVAGMSTLLGMGLPGVAAFILVAVLGAPALVNLGVPQLVAHLFIFYYANLSSITPPVGLAAYAAANIAGTDYNRTAFESVRIAIVAFIVPFFMVYQPSLLLMGSTGTVILALITSVIGMFGLAIGVTGWVRAKVPVWGRVLAFLAGLFLFRSEIITDLIGLALLALVLFHQYILIKKGGEGQKIRAES
ncbi:MAG: TRAP transporter fused permease subunit [Firmicutes bacterium]|nr:TRAP transporter fused permease subunit [Bacillota bacterium]